MSSHYHRALFCQKDVVVCMGFSVRAGAAERKSISRTFILVRLMPGIDANYSSEVTRVQQIDELRFALGLDVRTVLAAIRLEGRGNRFQLGTGARSLLNV